MDANNGFQRWLRYVSPEGKRSDSAHAYVHPLLQDGKHPNLHVLVESKVIRVLFDENKRACGVEYTPNPAYEEVPTVPTESTDSTDPADPTQPQQPQEEQQQEQPPPPPPPKKLQIKARKLVVLSSGACGTPSILERSGVGSAAVLRRAGVDVVEDLPGVGHDYQDHHLILYPYRTALGPDETLDGILTGRLSVEAALAGQSPLLGWNSCDIAGKLRPSEEDVAALGPEFKEVWDADFRDRPDRPLLLMALVQGYDT